MDAKQLKDGDFFDITGKLFKALALSWEAFKLNWQVFVAALVAMVGVGIFAAVVMAIAFGSALTFGSDSSAGIGSILVSFLLVYLVVLALICVLAPLVITAQLASARKKQVTFSEAFATSKPKILGFIGLSILIGLTVMVGFILLFVPGLLAIFFLTYAPYIYLDKKIGIVDTMKASYELTKEYWKVTLGMLVVYAAVSIIGSITFVGQLASIALSVAYFCLGAIVYVTIAGKGTAVKEAEVVTAPKAKK